MCVFSLQLEGAVCSENCYDTGVCLTNDGIPSKPVYYSRLKSETLSVNSLHLLLWASFGALCISLVHKPGASESIKGNILSDNLHIRHFCLNTVSKLWNCIGSSLHLSAAEQSFYLKRCMLKMIHVS